MQQEIMTRVQDIVILVPCVLLQEQMTLSNYFNISISNGMLV